MNRVYRISVCVVAAAVAWACQAPLLEEPVQEQVREDGYKILTISAGRESRTKTSYESEIVFSWSEKDGVSVLCNNGTDNSWITFTTQKASASSIFTALVPLDMHVSSLDGKRVALYPASSQHVYTSGSAISYYVPKERDFREASGGHKETAIPLFAWGSGSDTYNFANMTGAIKFTFTGLLVPEVKFTFTANSEKMNGLFPLTGLEGEADGVCWTPETASSAEEKTLTYYAPVESDGSVSFYVPYPTGTLSAGSRITVADAESGAVIFEHPSLKAIDVEKNRVTVLRTLDLTMAKNDLGSFTETTGEQKNPERGFYDFNELHYWGYIPSGSDLYYYDDRNTLVFINFYLEDFIYQDHISADVLAGIEGVFNRIRNDGRKAIVRFSYCQPYYDEAEPATVLKHIEDLKPVFTNHADVIYVVQAGFIGPWGEWHNSYRFPLWTVDDETVVGFEDWAKVLDALLDAVPSNRQVAVRVPDFKRFYLHPHMVFRWDPITGWDGTDANSRISFHNDAFRMSTFEGRPYDSGTFRNGQLDLDMWETQSAYLAVGGEPNATFINESNPDNLPYIPDPSYYGKEETLAAIDRQHMSYLNGEPWKDLTYYWQYSLGCYEDIRQALGYRLWLKDASLYYNELKAGDPVFVEYTLNNTGSAPVINPRPMKLVLLRGGTPTVLVDNMGEVRNVASKGSFTFGKMFALPFDIQDGDQLAIWLPDEAPGLQGRAEYSIRLANSDVEIEWTTEGYNVFQTLNLP